MKRIIYLLFIFVGCSHYTMLELNSLYKILRIDNHLLLDHHLITLQSLNTMDTVYVVSRFGDIPIIDSDKSMLIKEKITIRVSLNAYNRLLLVDRSNSRLTGPIWVTSSTGKTIIRMDTLVVPVFISNEINGLLIRKERVY